MKKLLTAAALAVLALAPVAVQAAVVPSDWNGDGLTFTNVGNTSNPYKPQQTFYDAAHHLLWTNTTVAVTGYPDGLTLDDAANFLADLNSSTNLSVLNNERLHTWHIPTVDEFNSLVNTQGWANQHAMNRLPFSYISSYVWTSTITTTLSGKPGHFGFALNSGSFTKFPDSFASQSGQQPIKMYLWAVTSVPEPETYAMLLAGLGVMGAVARRRQSKQA